MVLCIYFKNQKYFPTKLIYPLLMYIYQITLTHELNGDHVGTLWHKSLKIRIITTQECRPRALAWNQNVLEMLHIKEWFKGSTSATLSKWTILIKLKKKFNR